MKLHRPQWRRPACPRPLALAAALVTALAASGAAQATISVYTDPAAFLAAVSAAGTDSFDSLAPGLLDSPLVRDAGAHAYTATDTVDPTYYDSGSPLPPGQFYVIGSGADHWLSSNAAGDTITFTGLGNVRAIGGLFFGTDIDGALLAGATLHLVATDGGGALARDLVDPSGSSFLGFVSDGALVSLAVSAVPPQAGGLAYATVNDLVLAAPVPEPQTWALMLAGVGLFGLLRRRPA